MHSLELIPRFSSEAAYMLEDTGTEINVEKKSSYAERETDSDYLNDATANRESNLERNQLQDADVDNSLNKNLLQDIEINNPHEETLLQDTEVDNCLRENVEDTLLQDTEDETNSLEKETPVLVTTRSGRVSRPHEQLQDFHCWNIDESICSTQTKDSEESSIKIVSSAAPETTAWLDHGKLFLLFAVLIKK